MDETPTEDCGGPEAIEYWEPRVMRHRAGEGRAWFAVHEVYFDRCDKMVTYTLDAVSPAALSIDELMEKLLALLKHHPIVSGERGYTYTAEDVEAWIEALESPILEYDRAGGGH